MNHGSILGRLVRGTRWSYRAERHDATLPADLDARVMAIEASDRLHEKQGRSTARVRFDGGGSSVSVYLKRHYRLPWASRVLATLDPRGRHSPGAAEWAHLERARGLGIDVPEVVAVGERIGPWGRLESYLMVGELVDHEPLHEAIPALRVALGPAEFARAKRAIVREVAAIAARLHSAGAFHKDLYLCHFFLDRSINSDPASPRLRLIDLHRLAVHRWSAPRWRWKDLGQLLYSTLDVDGIDDRDRLRFWRHYRRLARLRLAGAQRAMIRGKAARYRSHNR